MSPQKSAMRFHCRASNFLCQIIAHNDSAFLKAEIFFALKGILSGTDFFTSLCSLRQIISPSRP
jgi:hypothetical protein